jgi:hypothetical protein
VTDWLEYNQRALAAELDRVAATLEAYSAQREVSELQPRPSPPALETVTRAFGLSGFERDVLLLCAGIELEARFADLCAAAAGNDRLRRPTFGLALVCLPRAHWSALAPAAPLRRWRLVELGEGESVATSPLRIDERVLHYLAGLDYLDDRLAGLVEPVPSPEQFPASQAHAVEHVASVLRSEGTSRRTVLLCGADAETRRGIAAAACGDVGLRLHIASAADLPTHGAERDGFARLWEREAALTRSGLLIELEDGAEADAVRRVAAFVDTVGGAVLVGARDPVALGRRPAARVDAPRPTPAEQRRLWEETLGTRANELDGSLDAIVAQFDLTTHAIAEAAAQAASANGALDRSLWEACRVHARPRLDDLAQRIEALADWTDLVLPRGELDVLREIASHVRQRARVYEEWGFARKSARGLGISALFEGASGTGKTMAAEVLAGELDLDLYRIDLSQVVSKYIGETEKNLRRVFDAAEAGSAVLLFDEADALFGKRSEVKDSHDRYANIEVSYLLQRMEAYRGLAILTTNAKDAIDDAFMRRIRFVVHFAFPAETERAEIWRRIFPPQVPVERLAADALARLNVSGGSIRNVALSAAFLAADEGESVGMRHLARAARRECAKLERPLPEEELRSWT